MKNCEYLNIAKRVLKEEREALSILLDNLPINYSHTIDTLLKCTGRIIISGMGKSGYIGKKIAASLSSTGTVAFFIHPAEASHGDLGNITKNDIVMLFSNSGETRELTCIINYCKRFSIPMIGISLKENSTLQKIVDIPLSLPALNEASMIDAPTTSSIMMLALGDAITVTLHEAKGFTKEDFKLFHPGGKIGASLLRVSEIMHVSQALPLIGKDILMSEALLEMSKKGFGCLGVLNEAQELMGVITDGDLRRKMTPDLLTQKAEEIMSCKPKVIDPSMLATQALGIMNKYNITSLFITENNIVKGLIHVHDLLRAGIK